MMLIVVEVKLALSTLGKQLKKTEVTLSLEMWSSLHLSLSLSWPGAAAWPVCLERDEVMSEAKTLVFLLRRGLASVPREGGPWRASLEENTELGGVLGCWGVLAPPVPEHVIPRACKPLVGPSPPDSCSSQGRRSPLCFSSF